MTSDNELNVNHSVDNKINKRISITINKFISRVGLEHICNEMILVDDNPSILKK